MQTMPIPHGFFGRVLCGFLVVDISDGSCRVDLDAIWQKPSDHPIKTVVVVL